MGKGALFVLLSLMSRLVSSSLDYDVVVYSSTPAGIAAAIAARVSGVQKVLLIEPTAYVGGMASPGGIGLRDCNNEDLRTNNSTQYEWGMRNAKFYGATLPVWQPDNWVGEMNFKQMLADYKVELQLNTNFKEGRAGVVTKVDQSGLRRVTALLLENGDMLEGKYFIDASYEGELMMATGHVSFTYGREGMSEYNESFAGITNSSLSHFKVSVNPYELGEGNAGDATNTSHTQHEAPMALNSDKLIKYVQEGPDPRKNVGKPDKNLMAYSFRACLTNNPSNNVPFPEPAGYNPLDFELARRLLLDDLEADITPDFPWNNLGYMSYPSHIVNASKYDACCGFASVGIDAAGLAVGYATASRAERRRIYNEHKYYVQGLMWFWSTDPSVPENMRDHINSVGLCKDEWPENGNFPPMLYVREAVRMVGDNVYIQQDRVPAANSGGCVKDSIGVASWGIDIHEMQRVSVIDSDTGKPIAFNEGLTSPSKGGAFVFEIPYYIVLPKRQEMVNLAVLNCPSVSHVAFAAVRVEPTLWQVGQAAGTAAALGVLSGDSLPLQDVNVEILQRALIAQGGFVHWPPR